MHHNASPGGAGPLSARRSWLQFGLRSFLVLLTAFAVWLGWKAERARNHREAVKAERR